MDRSEGMATTTRPPAYAELLVDSLDRYTSGLPATGAQITNSNEWQTNLQQIVLNGYFTRLAVSQIQFFWNLPTIIPNYNDQIIVAVTAGAGAGTYTLTIPGGFYTPASMAAQLQSLLQAAAPAATFTVTFTGLNGAFLIDAAGAGTQFVIAPAGTTANRLTRTYITLGFMNTGGVASDLYLGSPPTMLATRFIDICSSILTKFQRVKDTTSLQNPTISNIIARVYPTAPNTRVPLVAETVLTDSNSIGSAPFVICIDYNTPKHIKWNPEEALSNFDLQLRDEFGALLTQPQVSMCEYQLTILASES
jgi:hypothetical protein